MHYSSIFTSCTNYPTLYFRTYDRTKLCDTHRILTLLCHAFPASVIHKLLLQIPWYPSAPTCAFSQTFSQTIRVRSSSASDIRSISSKSGHRLPHYLPSSLVYYDVSCRDGWDGSVDVILGHTAHFEGSVLSFLFQYTTSPYSLPVWITIDSPECIAFRH